MSTMQPKPVLYLVVCAAPPAQRIDELIELLHQADWNVCVIPTPRAVSWLDRPALVQQTGYPVRHDHRQPGDPDALPRADAIVVAPATFNTINKWSAGISDTFALGILNEAFGLNLPTVVAPYAKSSLAAHPEFSRSLEKLNAWGVNVLPNEAIRTKTKKLESTTEDEPAPRFHWQPVVAAVMKTFEPSQR
ncbi:MAG TPA: flavoprotein [Pseudonocardiaceae bacterium]|nr:flavoprotein [Pseudonocardiaceae bacterium]